jgi:hypothetical protein
MVVVADKATKKVVAVHTRVLMTAVLLEQEQCTAATLDEAAWAAIRMIGAPTPPSTLTLVGSLSSNIDDYEAVVITNLHI